MGRKDNGFTLIELLIVIAVIAILAVIIFSLVTSSIFKSNDAKRKADLDRIKIAIEEYEKDHNCYPPPKLITCNTAPLNGTGLQPYLNKIPCDPVTKVTYYYEYDQTSECPSWFRVYTHLDNLKDVDIMPACGPLSSFNYYVSSPNAPQCSPASGTGSSGTGGGSTPTPTPSGGIYSNWYGCKSGTCVPILWLPDKRQTECVPGFQSMTLCTSSCNQDPVGNECQPI